MVDLDPRWTAPIYKATSGEDFLGLRAVQGGIVGYLLPGIITITPRARYYAFYSWLLVEYSGKHPEGMSLAAFIKRREQIFVLANLAWISSSEDVPGEFGLLGSDKIGRHWAAHQDTSEMPLTVDDYLQASHGGYSQYAGVIRGLGLTRQEDSDNLDVLPRAQDLANSFADTIRHTRYYSDRVTYDTAMSIRRSVLEEYGASCHLSGLSHSPDRLPTLETLFAFHAKPILPPPDAGETPRGNMRGTLGLILDMLQQAQGPFTDDSFRQAIAYGLCADYESYKPAEPLWPFLAHWQMFQVRSYYVYAVYALWIHFLRWLRIEGPQRSTAYCEYLNEAVDLSLAAAALGTQLPSKRLDEWTLQDWMDELLNAADVDGDSWASRCSNLARKSDFPLNEYGVHRELHETRPEDPAYAGKAWILLSTLYLRLHGLQTLDQWGAWHWAKSGGARRRSLELFVRTLDHHLTAGDSVLEVWESLNRDYVVAQHIITALEKWRQRGANTFHFNYEHGTFEWLKDDRAQFTASRFQQAQTMLADLGLFEVETDDGSPRLTDLGRQTLERVLEACSG